MAPVPDPNSIGGGAKRDEATTKVPSKDPKKKDDKKEDDLVSSLCFDFDFSLESCFAEELVGIIFSIRRELHD